MRQLDPSHPRRVRLVAVLQVQPLVRLRHAPRQLDRAGDLRAQRRYLGLGDSVLDDQVAVIAIEAEVVFAEGFEGQTVSGIPGD